MGQDQGAQKETIMKHISAKTLCQMFKNCKINCFLASRKPVSKDNIREVSGMAPHSTMCGKNVLESWVLLVSDNLSDPVRRSKWST